ncbi:MAG TPA: universal stress protein [Anaerolineales bacterium]
MIDSQRERKLDIILAVDGSEHSFAAAHLLHDLPLGAGSTITALAVLVPRDASSHAQLQDALEQTRNLLQEKGVTVKTELLTGYPAAELTEYADRQRPDLMVLGAKGLRATLGILLGGVVQQLVEYAVWPVLSVRAPYSGLKRILLVTDGSEHSQRAVQYLTRFPLPEGAEVRAVHVLPPPPVPVQISHSWPVGMEVLSSMPSVDTDRITSRIMEEEETVGRGLLDRTVQMLEAAGIPATGVLLRGDAATEIIEYVKANQVDLIVAGSRGLSQMKRLLLGSLSRKLVHYAGCSVLLVKGGLNGAD